MKKKAILTSVLSIVLCLSLICGATFALFTDTETVNIAVTSGKVDVNASIELVAIRSRTMEWKEVKQSGTFETAGTATLNGNTLNLTNIVPGDEAVCKITVTNNSNVDVLYRTALKSVNDTGLFEALEVSIGNDANYDAEKTTYSSYNGSETISAWKKLTAADKDVATMYVKITFPYKSEDQNQYQDKATGIAFTVEAVQGNAEVAESYVSTAAEFAEALELGGNIVLANDISITASEMVTDVASIPVALAITDGKNVVIDLNGHDITVPNTGDETTAAIHVLNSNLTIKGEGTITQEGTSDYVLWAKGNSTVNIEGGTFVAKGDDTTTLYASSNEAYDPASGYATINVYGGTFINESSDPQDYANVMNHGAGRIVFYGGTYSFDPVWSNYSDPDAKDDTKYITIAEGYKAVTVEGLYYIVPDTIVDADLYIMNVEQLQAFAAEVNGGNTYEDKTVALLNDIDLTNVAWTPINNFKGTFNGNGKTISNLSVEATKYAGLFGYLAAGYSGDDSAVITNLTINGANVTANHDSENDAYAGALVGYHYSMGGKITITDVTVKNSTLTGKNVGAIGGTLNGGLVTGCVSTGNTINGTRIGGLLGSLIEFGSVTGTTVENNSLNVGTLTDESAVYVGTIVGRVTGGTVEGNVTETKTIAKVEDSTDLANEITSGNTVLKLSEGTYTLPPVAGKTLTIIGTKDTKVSVQNGTNQNASGATITFNGVTILSDPESSGYNNGIAHASYVVYNNCVIEGTLGLQTSCEFNNCTFNIEGNYYNVWTWGAGEVTFNGCTFNCDGKALLVYDSGNSHQTVNITDCVFNDKGDDTVTGKAAIEITCTYNPISTYDVFITNTTVNGFSQTKVDGSDFNANYGSVAGSNIGTNVWGNKCELPNTQINVVIDGVDVY